MGFSNSICTCVSSQPRSSNMHECMYIYTHTHVGICVRFPTLSQLPHPLLRKTLIWSQNSNLLSDSCFLFCEPTLLGSWAVTLHMGPAGHFPDEIKKKKIKWKWPTSPAVTHEPGKRTKTSLCVSPDPAPELFHNYTEANRGQLITGLGF